MWHVCVGLALVHVGVVEINDSHDVRHDFGPILRLLPSYLHVVSGRLSDHESFLRWLTMGRELCDTTVL